MHRKGDISVAGISPILEVSTGLNRGQGCAMPIIRTYGITWKYESCGTGEGGNCRKQWGILDGSKSVIAGLRGRSERRKRNVSGHHPLDNRALLPVVSANKYEVACPMDIDMASSIDDRDPLAKS
ncbi:hypothetical protein MaudCBS49596_005316 [Microsporum audouinii]